MCIFARCCQFYMVKFHLDRDNWNISYGYFESFVGICFDLTQTCLSPAFKIQHEVFNAMNWTVPFSYLAILTWGFDKCLIPTSTLQEICYLNYLKYKNVNFVLSPPLHPPYIHPHAPITTLRLRFEWNWYKTEHC